MANSTFECPPLGLGSVRIIESVYLTESEDQTVRRTWWERWFTRPWQPWEMTKVVRVDVPMKAAVRLDRNTFLMHPATVQQMRADPAFTVQMR